MRSCHEIANCPDEAKLMCKAFNSGHSCWMDPASCPCGLHVGMSCEVCPIYQEHRKDLENIARLDPNKNRRRMKEFMKKMEPIFRYHVPENGDKSKAVDKRKRRVIKQLTIKLLHNKDEIRSNRLEKNLHQLFREIFQ